MKKSLILLFSLLLISCNSKDSADSETYTMPVFKQELSVTPKYIHKDKPLAQIFYMQVYKDYLLFKSSDENNLVQLFNKNTGEYVAGIAPRGRGAGEYPMTVDFFFLGDTLCVYDRQQLVVNYYESDFVGNRIPFKRIQIEGANGFLQIVPYKRGFITVPTKGVRFIIQDETGKQIGKYTHYPNFNAINDSSIVRNALFTGSHEVDIKPDHTKLVSATFAGAIIEIFSLSGNKINLDKEIRLLPPTLLKRKDNSYTTSDESFVGFWNIHTTDDYIYLIFSGKTLKDHKKHRCGDFIYVYDWEGNPIKSYKINGGIYRFTIDEAQQRIFLITYDQDGDEIIGYFNL
ncbi:MAG: BF3164 family lipoprotein [Bacteroidales bacterium]